MDTSDHNISTLFMQLGLDSSATAIDEFIANHKIAANQKLEEASFWTPAQAQFILEARDFDSDWAIVVDQLDTMLRN